MEAHMNSRSFYLPGSMKRANDSEHRHIFFIAGNPGLVAYYHSFLSYLHELLAGKGSPSYSVHAVSLPNFSEDTGKTLSLQAVISSVEENIHQYVSNQQQSGNASSQPVKIIVIGHSVGAYIGLEIVRRWQENQTNSNEVSKSFQITGFVGLWPTITWISKSSNGKIATFLLNIPGFLPIISRTAKALITLTPLTLLLFFVRLVTGFPDGPARVTGDFLQSRRGLYQTLYMARDEMNEIREDRWSKDIWELNAANSPFCPKMAFHFGLNDRWVADETRDELIAERAAAKNGSNGKPLMEIDKDNIPHAFCIRESTPPIEIIAQL